MTLSRKLRVAFLALGLLAIGLTDWQARQIAADALTNATEERLITLREIRRQQIESYFSTLRGQLQALSNDEASLEALVLFHNAILRLNGPKPGDLDRLERFYWDEFLPAAAAVLGAESSTDLEKRRSTGRSGRYLGL